MSKEKNSCINEFLNEVQRIEIIGQINLSVKTGNQYNVEYVELLKELQQSALTELLSLEGKQINLHIKRFEHIKNRFIEFWSYYTILCNKYRSDSIDIFEFKKKISYYFIVSNFTATKITEEFLFDLQDAIMLRDGSLRGLIDQYNKLINSKKKQKEDPERKSVSFFCQLVNHSKVIKQGEKTNEKYCMLVCEHFKINYTDKVRQYYKTPEPEVAIDPEVLQKVVNDILPKIDIKSRQKIDKYIASKKK